MSEQKTHRMVNKPKMSARHLADYMAGSERARRTIVRNAKFQPIARVIQHDEARRAVSRFLRTGHADTSQLEAKAVELDNRLETSPFDRDVLDHNADYIRRFAAVSPDLILPDAECSVPGNAPTRNWNGTDITIDLSFRLQRVTKTNKIKSGAAMLRYQKGKPLAPEIAAWQSAYILGYLKATEPDDNIEPEGKLCLTIDAQAGVCHTAPSDAVSRFNNMKAACESIAERWPNVSPPPNAIY